jgi:outer membrane cobalamin receptor
LEITQLLIKSEWLLSVQKSKNVSPYPSQLQLGNQLPYVPYLSSIWANTFSFRRYTLTVDQSYTGRRFTTLDNDNKYSVASFYLLDISMASSLDFQKIAFDLSFKVGNVLNDYYENIKNRAMPGVNFQFQITTKL